MIEEPPRAYHPEEARRRADVGAIPWATGTLEQDKAFLLRAIADAKAKTGWDRLGYSPREDWIMERLDRLAVLVAAFAAKDIAGWEAAAWPWGKPEGLTLCEKHGIYRHLEGCVICDD